MLTLHWDSVARMIQRAIPRGARQRHAGHSHSWEWDISAGCLRPVLVEVTGKTRDEDELIFGVVPKAVTKRVAWVIPGRVRKVLFLDLLTKCRRCDVCRRKKAAQWRARAVAEIAEAQRTWFVTLTLTPHQHYKVLAECGVDEIVARHRVISKWITKAIKRLRKNTGAKLRYMLVCEAHQSGLPHYHMLIHEIEGTLRYRDIRAMWPFGFCQAKLVDEESKQKAAWYVCKYIAKDMKARVRASLLYGRNPVGAFLQMKKLLHPRSFLQENETISDPSEALAPRDENDIDLMTTMSLPSGREPEWEPGRSPGRLRLVE